jgi:hypothetical protein
MVYETSEPRYPNIPLRMAREDIGRFIRSQNLCCSHYDAFRFFTPSARPLNQFQPAKITQPDFEQSGCLHVNMDLYKWAYKFYPWIPSGLIADAFFLAFEARELDMRASPYDLAEFGFKAIAVETEKGREEYQKRQQSIREKSIPLRRALLGAYRRLADWIAPLGDRVYHDPAF